MSAPELEKQCDEVPQHRAARALLLKAWLKKHMPVPGRLAWRFIGAPDYARFRAAVEGRTATEGHTR